jgi:hypothetical protein
MNDIGHHDMHPTAGYLSVVMGSFQVTCTIVFLPNVKTSTLFIHLFSNTRRLSSPDTIQR